MKFILLKKLCLFLYKSFKKKKLGDIATKKPYLGE